MVALVTCHTVFVITASIVIAVFHNIHRERECLHREWLERERISQEEFRLRKEKEDAAQKKKEDEEVTQELISIYLFIFKC